MNESQYRDSRNKTPNQGYSPDRPTKDSYDSPKQPDTPPEKDPCDAPKPDDPKSYEPPPCPPKEEPCPPKGPCPQPPKRPCLPPDPCVPASDDAEQPPDDKEPRGDQYLPEGKEPGDPSQPPARNGYKPAAGGSEAPAGGSDATGAKPVPASDPAGHLAALKAKLDKEQKRLLELEPLKTSTADLAQRIATLEKAAEGQAAAASTYKDFYRTTEVALHEIKCFIPTVRCQLDEIKDKQKACICEAIKKIDARVNKARSESAAARKAADDLERKSKEAALVLEWAQKWYDFLKSGLQQHVTKQRDDLKALKLLADPGKDQCAVWFHLYEMERVMKSVRDENDTKGNVCWNAEISIGTFLDCWGWECYQQAWNWIVVEFNTAEADDKLLKTLLDQAKKRAVDLDKLAKEAESKRREWILKEIKTMECCGPASKCP